jgi:Domain of unknown function (DUF1963)
MHEVADIEQWKAQFPLQALRDNARAFVAEQKAKSPENYPDDKSFEHHVQIMSPGGEIITSPFHLAVVEQLRVEALAGRDFQTAPTDVFVFGKGEAASRGTTKVGGLPFLPATSKWPVGPSGKPMDFVGQFCFCDSMDMLPELPAQVLLIFADGVLGDEWTDEEDGLHFEWVQIGERNLVSLNQIPEQRWKILPCYGVRHRSVDYVGVTDELDDYKQPWCIDIFEGTKIGGTPRFIQGEEDVGGQFLCALGSIQPEPEKPFPFVKVGEPFDYWAPKNKDERDRFLMWGDVGSLYLFLQSDGSIRWTIQCY